MANELNHNDKQRAESRRRNLDKLIGNVGKRGRISEFADKYDFNPSYISQVLGGHRLMGDKAARRFEKTIGINEYSLDQDSQNYSSDAAYQNLRDDQVKLLQAYEQSDAETRTAILKLLAKMTDLLKKEQ